MKGGRVVVILAAFGTAMAACTLLEETNGLSGPPEPSEAGVADAAADGSVTRVADGAPAEDALATFDEATPCPTNGGVMVNVGTHCIDKTEVTIREYDAFLRTFPDAGAVDASDQPAYCRWNTDLRHGDFINGDVKPVTEVDWCDAFAFCRWAGKRLCGGRKGGPVPFDKSADPSESQWQYACSSGGKHAWVYGDSYVGTACRGFDCGDGYDYPFDVRKFASCQAPEAPFTGVYDLAGNASEWEDSCERFTDNLDLCRLRGGDRASHADGTRCDAADEERRDYRGIGQTFRCCWP